jgi:uncharacterized linocin/CFP29 family protein
MNARVLGPLTGEYKKEMEKKAQEFALTGVVGRRITDFSGRRPMPGKTDGATRMRYNVRGVA